MIFKTGRGGRLWVLYPTTHGEVQARYQCREMNREMDSRAVTNIVEADEQLSDKQIDRQWTALWELGDDTDE